MLRVMRNPAAVRTDTTGPYSVTYGLVTASGLLEVTAAELGLLNVPLLPASSTPAGTIRLVAGLAPQS